MSMEFLKKSEFLKEISSTARKRYTEKLVLAGLCTDPYCMPVEEWEKDPCDVPAIDFSNEALYMVTTPSPYTEETVKVNSI